MTFIEAKYLKHVAETLDIKLTIRIIDGEAVACIMDEEYRIFEKARARLEREAQNIVGDDNVER